MSRAVTLSKSKWMQLHRRLLQDYPKSVVLISSRSRSVLGFTSRDHVWWDNKTSTYQNCICLDFYNESKRTMFLLKYSDYLDKTDLKDP